MRLLITLCTLFWLTTASAIFCPTNFTSISLGDSLEQVLAQCGPPLDHKFFQSNGNLAQEWTYFVKAEAGVTERMVVIIANDKINQITLFPQESNPSTAQALPSTMLCGFPIKLGDSSQVASVACGKPLAVKPIQLDGPSQISIKIDELRYAGPPAALLIFKDNKLIDRKFL